MPGVRDEQPLSSLVRKDGGGEAKNRRAVPFVSRSITSGVRSISKSSIEPRDRRLNGRIDALARAPARDVARRVDEVRRRPRVNAVGRPDGELGVVDDGVFESILADRLKYARVVLLPVVLAGVNADDDERVAELLFEPSSGRG